MAGGGSRPAGDPLGRSGGGLTPVVLLPSLLAAEAGGQKRFEVEATTLREALSGLPIANLIFDESGAKRALVNLFVDGAETRDLDAQVSADAEIRIVAAIAGGS